MSAVFPERKKFETGFSKSHITAEELRAQLYSDINTLRKQLGLPSRRRLFKYKLEVHEV